ncbi:MAG: FmdB family zinc ribbon protein [Candidatus Binataceae bacterium]
MLKRAIAAPRRPLPEGEGISEALGNAKEMTNKEIQTEAQMSIYWEWRCEACGHQFVLSTMRLPEPCHLCGAGWFRKVGESERKQKEATS